MIKAAAFGLILTLTGCVRGYHTTGGAEGAVQGSVVATYLHGPVLARNPELADLLLARAMGVDVASLEPLDLPVIGRLRAERIASKPRPKSER